MEVFSSKNVDFGYRGKDGKQCLKDISLDIPSGATLGIIGATGSGKSSLCTAYSKAL